MTVLTLPLSVERRKKLEISLGHCWIGKNQVPTVLATSDLAEATGRSPQLLFKDFTARKGAELIA